MDSSGSRAPSARPAATYKQVFEGPLLKTPLFKTIVGGFFSDDDVVHVALAQTGRRDADALGPFAQLLNGATAAVAHAGAQAAHELIHQIGQYALIGHPAFDAFGNQFAARGHIGFLGIAIGRTLGHRAHRSHAAVALESP